MSARKKSPTGTSPGDGTTFEAALSELEEIVAAMEEEQLPLEELVARYEKGSKLLARCESVLASARKRLQTISARSIAETVDPDDEADVPDEDDQAPGQHTAGTPDEHDDDDDIRLF
jgi:exodeoxyribonuclease VII small subunit